MDYNNVTMQQIRYFLAVAEFGSFTKAARALYTSQPSMSRQISLFEKQIGTKLLYRTKRTVRLTVAGETLYKDLADIPDRITRAITAASSASAQEQYSLKVGLYSEMASGRFVPGFLEEFRAKYPEVTLDFEAHSWQHLRERIESGALDLAIMLGFEQPDEMVFNMKKLKVVNTCVIMSQSNPLAERDEISFEEMKDESFVVISAKESPEGRKKTVDLCERYGFVPRIVSEQPNIESMLLAVQSGKGVTVLDNMERSYEQNGMKRYVIDDDFVDLIAVWRIDNNKPFISLFLDELSDYLDETELEAVEEH